MKKIILTLIVILWSIPNAHAGLLDASRIRVANKTPIPLYLALYYARNNTATRATTPVYLPADNAISLDLPSSKFLHSRRLCIAPDPAQLADTLALIHTESVPLGLFEATDFTIIIDRCNQTPHILETDEWKKLPPVPEFTPHHLAYKSAHKEEQFLAARRERVQAAQEALIQKTLPRPLHIGICTSGGGFRAMYATAGLMCGLEQAHLLPLITHCVGLSGSTWFLFPWLLSKQTATAYTEKLVTLLVGGLIHTLTEQYREFARLSLEKRTYSLPISGIDLYGISLAYTLLKPLYAQFLTLTMDDVRKAADPLMHPLVFGSVVTRPHPTDSYEWITISPFAVHFLSDHLTLPPALLGAHFYNHQQLTLPPAPSLCYYLAIFGSSFSVSVRDALERTPATLQTILHKLLPDNWQSTRWSNTKITAARIANPRKGIENSRHKTIHTISLVDGGYLNNLPLEPLLHSSDDPFDLLIVLDSKQERPSRIRGMLQGMTQAQLHTPRFPAINPDHISTQTFSVHGDPRTGPVVVYCTLEGCEDFDPVFNPATDPQYATLKFMYTEEKARKLVSLVSHVITANAPLITDIIHALAERCC
jgi:hypothetical protein